MGKYLDSNGLSHLISKIKTMLSGKQDKLVSGTNIKTVNNNSLLGSGNITISGSSTSFNNEGLPIGSGRNEGMQYRSFTASQNPDSSTIIDATFFQESGDWTLPADYYPDYDYGSRIYVTFDSTVNASLGELVTTSGMMMRLVGFDSQYSTVEIESALPIVGPNFFDLYDTYGVDLLTESATFEFRKSVGWDNSTSSYYDAWRLIGNPKQPSGGSGGKSTYYGTCSTSGSTAAKVVSGVTGWTPAAGDILTIYFSTANTAATPTLSINGTEYSLRVGNSAVSGTANVLKWSMQTTVTFVYDGTYFRYIASNSAASIDQPRGAATWYGTSTTAVATAAKTTTITNFVLTKGARVTVRFAHGNTANAPTLNVNSTGAKNMRIDGVNVSASNPLLWSDNSTLEFVYDGTGWVYIGGDKRAVSKHVTYGDGEDWYIEPNTGWTVTVNDYFTYDGLLIAQLGISANGTASAGTTYNPFTIEGVKMAFFVNDTAQGGVASMTSGSVWLSVQRTFSANTVFNVWMFAVLA